jgi:hypothetical protein
MPDITDLIDTITSRAMLDKNKLELIRTLAAAQLRKGGEEKIKAIVYSYARMVERLYVVSPQDSKKMAIVELDALAHIADFYDLYGEKAGENSWRDNDLEGKRPIRKFYRQAVKNLIPRP